MHFSGGQLKAYDGNVLVEQNFNYPPARMDIAKGTAGGDNTFARPSTVDDVYQYRAIFTFTDAQGNIHRSGLSNLETFTYETTATDSTLDNILVHIPSLPLTQKEDVYIELYRTTANGTVFIN